MFCHTYMCARWLRCVRTRVSEVEVVCRSFSMSHSMILVRVPKRIRYMVNLTYMCSRVADTCSATHICVQGGFGCVRIRVSEVEVVCRSFSMSHSMILIRVPPRIGGGQIYGHFDVYAFEGG